MPTLSGSLILSSGSLILESGSLELSNGSLSGTASYALNGFIDGIYTQAVEGTGAITQLIGAGAILEDGAAGTYQVTPTTNGSGIDAYLQLVITGDRGRPTLSLPSSSVLNGGSGYAPGDILFVPYTQLGVSNSSSLSITLSEQNVEISRASTILATTASITISNIVGDPALDGAIINLTNAEVTSGVGTKFFSGATGSYTIEVSSKTGTGGILELVVAVEFNSTYSIDLASSAVLEGGTGYIVGDSFDIPVTSLGGSSDEIVTITLVDGNIGVVDKSTLYLGPDLSGLSKDRIPSAELSVNNTSIRLLDDSQTGGTIVISTFDNAIEMIDGSGFQINGKNVDINGALGVSGGVISFDGLPTEDPQTAGQLWVDAANEYVLKVSQG